jgi:hypothetical protein
MERGSASHNQMTYLVPWRGEFQRGNSLIFLGGEGGYSLRELEHSFTL